MVMCFAPTCKHYSEKDGCTFFAFPKDPVILKKWIKLIRRADREPSKYSRICNCHFVDGDVKNNPTIFDYNVGKPFEKEEPGRKRKKAVASTSTAHEVLDPAPSHEEEGLLTQFEEDIITFDETLMESELSQLVTQSGDRDVEPAQSQFTAFLESENYFLKQDIEKLQLKLDHLSVSFSFDHIKNNDHLIKVYIYRPCHQGDFFNLFSLFENLNLKYFRGWQVIKIPKVDQLLMTLMKLKLNLLNDDLALIFNVSRETVDNIFKTWLFVLHEILFQQLMKDLPSRRRNKQCMPSSFSSFTNCRVKLDCTEMGTIHPQNMQKQRATYSSYKHNNTLKGLVGVAPIGVVTFVSGLYPGSISDKKITQHCGITQKLVPGDLVLADKDFLISDILPPGVSLNIPPFLTTPQFSTGCF